MASSDDERDRGEKQLLLSKNSSSHDYGNRRVLRKQSSRNLDLASIEAAFNKGVRPSLLGSGSYQVTLSWEHVSVKVKVHGKTSFRGKSTPSTEKLILTDVSGVVEPGSLVAIMGASGSGKSTLLNVLTNRNTKDYIVTGALRLNGVEVGSGIKNVSAYVQQDDLFISTLTVREHLQFRALLRMDKGLNKSARLKRVEEVIGEMGLLSCADTRIGTPGGTKKGISGGEKKRLTFASEALTGPPIFFCDEPTSSLDSFMAQTILQTMTNMARRGATILCTIHQPSSELFAMFGHIILLSEGRVAFMGKSQDCLKFFEGLDYRCPRNYNPADHYILTLAIEPGAEDKCRDKTNAICDAYLATDKAQAMLKETVAASSTADEGDHTIVKMVTEFAESSRYKSSWFIQFIQLFWRSWTAQFRDPILFGVRFGQATTVALMLGLIYLDQDIDQTGVQNINGSIFIILIQICFVNMFAVLTSFPDEINLVMREFGSGLYGLDTYYITKTWSEIPLFSAVTVLFGTVTYWMIGLHDSFEAFLINIGILILATIISASFGYAIAIICGETNMALSVATPVVIPFVLFGGLFLNSGDTPDYFKWLEWISWFKYSYEILLVNQWEDIDSIECDRRNVTVGNLTIQRGPCAYSCGQDVILAQKMDSDAKEEDLGILFAIWAGFYIFTYICLYVRGRASRE